MSNQPSSRYQYLILAGLVGFAVGVLGNLVAAWLQQDLLSNAFTPPRIAAILGLTALGLLAGAWLERRHSAPVPVPETDAARPRAPGVQLAGVQLLWSRLKSRGRGIGLDRVFSLGSDIDVDTLDNREDEDD